MVKRLYNPKSSREAGSMPYYKVGLGRTNVNGKVKGKYQAHDDFVRTVGTGLLLTLALKVLKMENVDEKPGVDFIPDNVARMHAKNRQPVFDRVVNEIVTKVHSSFTPEKRTPVSFEIHVPGTGPVMFYVWGDYLQRMGEVSVDVPGVHDQVQIVSNTYIKDDLMNYNTQLLQWFLLIEEFGDAIKEGDMFRCSTSLKHMLPFFYSHSTRSKYFIEIVDFILKTEVLLPPALALRCRLGSFVNPHGGAGNNKPADMQQENNILVLKDVIRGLGANKTEKALMRASKAAPVANKIVENYKSLLGVKESDGRHKSKCDKEDVNLVVNLAQSAKAFDFVPSRAMEYYHKCRSSAFVQIDKEEYSKHLSTVVNRIQRGAKLDDLFDEDD